MRSMSVREVNQNFSKVLSLVESGETVLVSKHGRIVARVAPEPHDRTEDPVWRAAFARLMAHFESVQRGGEPLGRITEEDKYGDADL